MELRDALRMLRSEIGLTQAELAAAVNVGYSAESRWENKNTRPNRASSMALLALAEKHGVSAVCLDALSSILLASRADDRADRELLEQVTERMKLEERVLLTTEQMKLTIDNLDVAVIVQRIFSADAGNQQVIYHNRRYAEIFGYTGDEFEKRSRENVYFSIPEESRTEYLRQLRLLLGGRLTLGDFSMVIRGFKRDGSDIWLELRGINLTRYAYGHELCLSCRDITQRIEAERKYAEEVALRDASIRSFYASFHCDLTSNAVFRHRDLAAVTGPERETATADGVFCDIADMIPDAAERAAFSQTFNCASLLRAFMRGGAAGSMTQYNRVAGRWLRYDYALMNNPYNGHIEAAVCVYDMQRQVLAEKMMSIVAGKFFDYIGLIDIETETVESYYTSVQSMGEAVKGRRDYPALCGEKLLRFADPKETAAQSRAVSLAYIRDRLSQQSFYSTVLHFRGPDGTDLYKKVTYTYLDETRQTIIVAQSDMEMLKRFAANNRIRLSGETQK